MGIEKIDDPFRVNETLDDQSSDFFDNEFDDLLNRMEDERLKEPTFEAFLTQEKKGQRHVLVFFNRNEKFLYMETDGTYCRGGIGEEAENERKFFDGWENKEPFPLTGELTGYVIRYFTDFVK